jgi:hypothetical protein
MISFYSLLHHKKIKGHNLVLIVDELGREDHSSILTTAI